MPADEGDALHDAALAAAAAVPGAPFIEVGSYCGRSTIWLGAAARAAGTVVFAVDHHRGSEENQAGLGAPRPDGRRRRDRPDGHAAVLPARPSTTPGSRTTSSPSSGGRRSSPRYWPTPAALVFIDGGHGVEPARPTTRAGRRTSPSAARWRSTTCSPTRPTAAGRRTSRSSCRPWRAAASGWRPPPARCASSPGRPAVSCS